VLLDDAGEPIYADNLLPVLIQHLEGIALDTDKALKKMKRAQKRAAKMAKRFKRKSQGKSLLTHLMQWKGHELAQRIGDAEERLSAHRRAIEILKDYDFDAEVMPAEEQLRMAMQRAKERLEGAGFPFQR